MRLICTISDSINENPYEFSYYLASQGIENECEEVTSSEGVSHRIWIYEEDKLTQALELYQEYQKNPKEARYQARSPTADRLQQEKLFKKLSSEKPQKKMAYRRLLSPVPYGPISILVLLTTVLLFIFAHFQKGGFLPPKIAGVVQAPVLAPLEKKLLYDYPYYFELRDQLLKEYPTQGIESQSQQPPSKEAEQLVQKLRRTPVWIGFYDLFLNVFRYSKLSQGQSSFCCEEPLFEKIRQGQLWRLASPSLLHLDLLHIFFNLLWFVILGNQVEFRLGGGRYLLLLLLTAIFSNTAQYLMSGAFFMGLSGIVVGLAAFIWARQQLAPWEGYLLHRYTLAFLAIFIGGMFCLQLALFALQLSGKLSWSVGIANTAHLVGALVGYLLGRWRFFALRSTSKR